MKAQDYNNFNHRLHNTKQFQCPAKPETPPVCDHQQPIHIQITEAELQMSHKAYHYFNSHFYKIQNPPKRTPKNIYS